MPSGKDDKNGSGYRIEGGDIVITGKVTGRRIIATAESFTDEPITNPYPQTIRPRRPRYKAQAEGSTQPISGPAISAGRDVITLNGNFTCGGTTTIGGNSGGVSFSGVTIKSKRTNINGEEIKPTENQALSNIQAGRSIINVDDDFSYSSHSAIGGDASGVTIDGTSQASPFPQEAKTVAETSSWAIASQSTTWPTFSRPESLVPGPPKDSYSPYAAPLTN